MTFKVLTEGKESGHLETGYQRRISMCMEINRIQRVQEVGKLLSRGNTRYIVGKSWNGEGMTTTRKKP